MRCAACDAVVPEGALYCARCGTRVVSPITGSERRVVTALFCDLVGSTELGERVDPEELDRLHRRYYALARAAIEAHGGSVEKFIGDAVAGLFGFPESHEDDPERAVRAACEILDEIRSTGLDVSVRIGVETGEAFVREDVEPGHGFATGDVMNTASRLQSVADPMSIAVGARAAAAARRSFVLAELPAQRLKGKQGLVQAWRVVGPARDAAAREATAATTFVGREAEIGRLRAAVAALAGGQGSVVLVEGDPGIGKSRLVREVRESSGALWLRGRSVDQRDAAGYRPFAEQVRAWVGGEAVWDELMWSALALGLSRNDAGLLATVAGIDPDDETSGRLAHLDPEALRIALFVSVRSWLDELAASRPVVLEFEDWHWADPASEQLLEHLLPLVEERPLLVVVVARPAAPSSAAVLERGADTLSRLQTLLLEPLTESEAQLLLDELVADRDLPRDLASGVLERAEGNPYFLEELSRFVAEGDGAMELPDSVRAAVTSRADRLDPDLRATLRVAAVIGRFFSLGLLERIDEKDGAAARLDRLVAARFVMPVGRGRYGFAHALTRESVYEGTPLAERRRLHREIAGALADEVPVGATNLPSIAYHLAQGEEWEAAASALVAAGQQAARIAADDEALEMYRAAIEAHERLPADRWSPLERSRIDREIADALRRLGRHDEAARQILGALNRLGVRLPRDRAAVRRAVLRQLLPRLLGPPELPPPDASPDPIEVEIDRELEILGWIWYFDDFDRVALSDLTVANRAARARDLEGIGVGTFRGALVFSALGRRGLAWRYGRRALEAAERMTDPVQVARTKQGVAIVALHFDGWEQAIALLEPALEVCAEAGELRLWATSAALLAFAANEHGDSDRARALGRAIEKVGLESGNQQVHGWGLFTTAGASLGAGDVDRAAEAAADASDVLLGVPDHLIRVTALGVLARAQLRRGDVAGAGTAIEEGLEIVRDRAFRGIFVGPLVEARAEAALLGLARGPSRESEAAAREAIRASLRPRHIGRWHTVHARVLDCGQALLLRREQRAARSLARSERLAGELGWRGAFEGAWSWVVRCCAEAGIEPPSGPELARGRDPGDSL
jgi:class 3 adenylate cyclase/tetratricopeptide (TPR) repeat protein